MSPLKYVTENIGPVWRPVISYQKCDHTASKHVSSGIYNTLLYASGFVVSSKLDSLRGPSFTLPICEWLSGGRRSAKLGPMELLDLVVKDAMENLQSRGRASSMD